MSKIEEMLLATYQYIFKRITFNWTDWFLVGTILEIVTKFFSYKFKGTVLKQAKSGTVWLNAVVSGEVPLVV